MDLSKANLDYLEKDDPVKDAALTNIRAASELGVNPDSVAKSRQLASTLHMPETVVSENMEAAQAKAWTQAADSWLVDAPRTSTLLADPQNAKVAHDDVEALRNIEMLRKKADDTPWFSQERREAVAELARAEKDNWGITRAYNAMDYQLEKVAPLAKRQLHNVLSTGAEDETLDVELFRAKALAPEAPQPENLFETAAYSAAELLPIILNFMGAYAAGGAAGGIGSGLTVAPGFFTPATAPAAIGTTLAGAGMGAKIAGGKAAFDLESALFFSDISDVRDENGEPLDPLVKAGGAVIYGAGAAALEFVGFSALAKILPGGSKITKEVLAPLLKEGLKDKAVQAALRDVAMRYASGVSVETLTELGQEALSIFTEIAAKGVSEAKDDTIFASTDWAAQAERMKDVGVKTLLGTALLGVVPAGASAVVEGRRARQVQTWRDQQAELHTAIQASQTMQRSPETMRAFGDILGLGEEVWIDAEALAQRGPELMQRISVDAETVAQAAQDGVSIKLNTSALMYEAEYPDLLQDLRPSPSAMSAREAESYDPVQALKDIEEASIDAETVVAEVIAVKDRMRQTLESRGMGEQLDANWELATRLSRMLSPKGDPTAFVQKLNLMADVAERQADGQMALQQDAAYAGVENQAEIEEAGRLWAEMGTESPYFKRWSGGAPVAETGTAVAGPSVLRVFHATRSEGIDAFRGKTGGIYFSADSGMVGSIFTEDGQGDPGEYFVRMEKPFEARWSFMSDKQKEELREVMGGLFDQEDVEAAAQKLEAPVEDADPFEVFTDGEFYFGYGRDAQNRVLQALADRGYDGVVFPDALSLGEPHDSFVAFSPTQIKSVNNRGTFDQGDARILYQIAEPVRAYAEANTGWSQNSAQVWAMLQRLSDFDARVSSLVSDQRATAEELDALFAQDPKKRAAWEKGVKAAAKELKAKLTPFNKDGSVNDAAVTTLFERKTELSTTTKKAVGPFVAGHGRYNAFEINKILRKNEDLKAEVLQMQDEINALFGLTPILNADGIVTLGIERRKAKYSTGVENDYKPQFGGFTRSFAQTFMDYLPDQVFETFRSELTRAVEHAHQNGGNGIPGVTFMDKALNNVSDSDFRVAGPVKKAEKTVGALNLNSACPMFMIGSHGCYFDGCYVTGMGMGGNTITFYNRAAYTGELLQLSQEDIDLLNSVGGLRLNGQGDLTDRQFGQLRDIVEHAKMRGLKLKVITKQDDTLRMIQRIADEGGDISGIQVQTSIDPYWIPVSEDELVDSFAQNMEINKALEANPDNETLMKMVVDLYAQQGREAKIIDGKVYRKYGYSVEKAMEAKKLYPDINFQYRVVVGTPEEVVYYARKHPEILQTWMHASIRPGMYSDVVGRMLKEGEIGNFTARIAVVQDENGVWHVRAQERSANEPGGDVVFSMTKDIANFRRDIETADKNIAAEKEKISGLRADIKDFQFKGKKTAGLETRLAKAQEKIKKLQDGRAKSEKEMAATFKERDRVINRRAKDIPLAIRDAYTRVEQHLAAQPDADKLFRVLAGSLEGDPSALCCSAGADKDACNNCVSHCHRGAPGWGQKPAALGDLRPVAEKTLTMQEKLAQKLAQIDAQRRGITLNQAAQRVDEVTGLPLNPDGTVTVYHHTSADKAAKVEKSGQLVSAGEPHVYVSTRKETDTGYGDTAVPVRVDPELLELDDEFPDGRTDYRISVGKPGGSIRVGVGQGITLNQPSAAPRGSYNQLKDGSHLVRLFEQANASTMPHELAHAFLTELRAMAETGVADEAMLNDLQKIEAWLDREAVEGSPEWQSYYEDGLAKGMNDAQARERATFVLRHEKFSRGFEQYLWEGKAPEPELEGIFARFSRWLKQIYQDALAFGVNLDPEIRSVFDRMLKADAEVESKVMELGFTPMTEKLAKHLGLGPEDRDYAVRLYSAALEKAEAKLAQARNKGLRKLRAEWKKDAIEEAKNSPVHQMLYTLRKGRGIDKAEFLALYGDEAAKGLPKGILREGGLSLNEAAFEHNYDTHEQMVNDLWNYRKPEDIAAEVVEAKTAERDAAFKVEDFILETAEFAAYQELMAKAYDKNGNVLSNKAFRDYARKIVATMPLADAMDVRGFLAAMARHHKAETKALKAGKLAEAAKANKKARLNHAYAQEALNVRKQVEKAERMAKRLTKLKAGQIEEGYHKALLQLIQRFGLTKKDYSGLQDVPALADLVKLQDAFGADEEASFSQWLLSGEARNYKDLTSGEFEELQDLMKFLYGTGKDLIQPTLKVSGLTMDEVKEQIIPQIEALPKRGKRRKEGTWLRKMQDQAHSYLSQNRTLLWVIRELDGYTALKGVVGPLEKWLYEPLEAANLKRAELSRQLEKRTRKARAQLLKSATAKANKVSLVNLPVPPAWQRQGRVWDFDACLSVLMNMGNAVNRQRVMDGYNLTEQDLQQILAVFSQKDAEAVQDIWDAMDEILWPEIAGTHKKLRFYTPGKVAAEAFTMPDGTVLRGGYYPLKYDPSADTRAARNQDLDKAVQNPATAMLPKSVASGATKARAASAGGMPVLLRTSVLSGHLDWAVHYASHALVIHDLGRILGDKEIAEAMKTAAGEETFRAANELVKRIANPRAGDTPTFLDTVFGKLTGISAVYSMWMNRFGPLTQPTAIGNYIAAEGGWGKGTATWMKGAAHFLAHPAKQWAWLMENNAALKNHFTLIRQQISGAIGEDFRDIQLGKTKSGRIWTASKETVIRGGIAMYGVMDAVVSVPGWYGSYLRGLDEELSTEEATVRANKIMAEYTPMSRDMDKTLFQHTKGMARAWTYMMSYFTKQANTNAGFWKAWRQGAIGTDQFIGQIVAVQILPAVVVSMMYSLLTGDDDDRDNILLDAGLEVAAYPFAGLPFAREGAAWAANLARAGITGDTKKLGRNAFQMPGMMYLQLMQRAGSTTYAMVQDFDDDETQAKALMAMAELAAATAGMPPVPKVAKEVMRGLDDIDDDEGNILNVLIKPKIRKRD